MKKSLILFLTPLIALPLLASTASEKPNIIFIFSDDMGYGDLGYTGSSQIKTPNLDKLAKDGIIFPQAYVTASVCGPSRAGVLTGRYQQRFGFETNPRGGPHLRPEAIGLPDRELTLGNRMQEAGYHTAAIGKWHMGYTDYPMMLVGGERLGLKQGAFHDFGKEAPPLSNLYLTLTNALEVPAKQFSDSTGTLSQIIA